MTRSGDGPQTPGEAAPEDEPFLARWARRKRAAVRGEPEAENGPDSASAAAGADEAADDLRARAAVAEAPPLTDADMPAIESLDEGSDYSGFLSPGVSEELRRLALRKLFTSSVFNLRDGLDDYDEDFRSFGALGDMVTSDMRHQARTEEAKARAEEAKARAAGEGGQAETQPVSGEPGEDPGEAPGRDDVAATPRDDDSAGPREPPDSGPAQDSPRGEPGAAGGASPLAEAGGGEPGDASGEPGEPGDTGETSRNAT